MNVYEEIVKRLEASEACTLETRFAGKEGLISEKEAVLRVSPSQLGQLLHPSLDPKAPKEVIAKGLPASPGAASGAIVFSAEDAEAAAAEKRKVVLVRLETSPEDIHGMDAAQGILTARGGMTSHAAVVTRGMGKCCVVGCSDIKVDYQKKQFSNRQGEIFKEGDIITLNGSTGEVMRGAVPTIQPDITGDFATLMGWVDKYKKLGVRANADTPKDARVARNFGADGIGLVRTEHMFFQGERIRAMREMIMAEDIEGRQKALAKILPMQRQDYYDIFIEMKDLPVMIRLLDPPLNEFLPQEEREMAELAEIMGMPLAKVKAIAEHLHENNPMLGHRGCRLGMTFPEIYDMQVQAIIEAACELTRDKGFNVVPEIMMPLVATYNEMHLLKERADKVAAEVMERLGVKIKYMVGACVELPRTCLIADRIAEDAEFFSFGTNDLTQTTYGLSRDDSGDFLPFYVEHNLYEHNPFISIDQTGVGEMVKIGCERGRKTRPNLKIGICGEHGGEPESIKFFHRIGLNYVSCSPFRVPVARLAAAHGALEEEMKKG